MFFRLTATQESRHINGCFRTRKGRRVLNLTLIFGRPDIRTIRLTDAPMICPTGCLAKFVSSPLAKNFFAFRFGRNRNRANHPVPLRGALRENVTDVGHGMRWTQRRARRAMPMRTAKSCGPDAPTLVCGCAGARHPCAL